MTRGQLIAFVRARKYAVVASVAADGAPQAAVVGVAVTDELELVFDCAARTAVAGGGIGLTQLMRIDSVYACIRYV